jgi:Right handed beta helix region
MKIARGTAISVATVAMLLGLCGGQASASTVNCGDTITQDTTLDADLLGCAYPAMTITGDSVTLDLNQHVVEGGISTPFISRNKTNVVLENGTVRTGGVSVSSYATTTIRGITTTEIRANDIANHVLTENNTVVGDGQGGIEVSHAPGEVNHNVVRGGGTGLSLYKGFVGSATDNLIEGNQYGMDMAHSSATLVANTVRANTYYGVTNGQGGPYTWIRNVISDNGGGMGLGYGHVLKGNIITRNAGDGIATYSPVSLYGENNTITDNGGAGIRIAGDTDTGGSLRLANSTVSGNRGDGIALSNFHTVEITGTSADRNGGDGIRLADIFPGSTMPTLTGNHTWFNGNLGMEAVPGTLGGDNWAKHNGNPLQCLPSSLCSTTGKPKG